MNNHKEKFITIVRWIVLLPSNLILSMLIPPLYESIMKFIAQFKDGVYMSGEFLRGFVLIFSAILIAPSHKLIVGVAFITLSLISSIYLYFSGNGFLLDYIIYTLGTLFAFFLYYISNKD